MKILFIGDIVGEVGLRALREYLPVLLDRESVDIVIANGENAADNGRGLCKSSFKKIIDSKVNIITLGNHAWDSFDIYKLLPQNPDTIIRPGNFPSILPGKGWTIHRTGVKKVAVINISGQVFMPALNCPFETIDNILAETADADYRIVDFHAEATSEKLAFAHYIKDRVDAIVGTHTHVQTNDARILDTGCAYITDVGMTGSYDGVIGMESSAVVQRFVKKIPMKLEADKKPNQWQFSAVIIELGPKDQMKNKIKHIHETSVINI